MDDGFMVTVYMVVDETMRAMGHRSHESTQVSDAEVLTVVVAANTSRTTTRSR